MAIRVATYTYADVLNIASRSLPRTTENDAAQFIANSGTNLIWNRYDWRETLAKLPPFYLVPNIQDHGSPMVSVPSNFFGLRKAWWVQASTIPPMTTDLTILADLNETHVRGMPQSISYNGASSTFRLYPRVPDNIGSPEYYVAGEYKIRPTKVLAAALAATVLPFDDVYFGVWVEVIKWAALNFAGDPRAGEVSVNGSQKVYTGQLAKAMAAMEDMATSEGLEYGDKIIAPSEGLIGSQRGGTLGNYPGSGW